MLLHVYWGLLCFRIRLSFQLSYLHTASSLFPRLVPRARPCCAALQGTAMVGLCCACSVVSEYQFWGKITQLPTTHTPSSLKQVWMDNHTVVYIHANRGEARWDTVSFSSSGLKSMAEGCTQSWENSQYIKRKNTHCRQKISDCLNRKGLP